MNLNKRQQLLAILAIVAVGLFIADKLVAAGFDVIGILVVADAVTGNYVADR